MRKTINTISRHGYTINGHCFCIQPVRKIGDNWGAVPFDSSDIEKYGVYYIQPKSIFDNPEDGLSFHIKDFKTLKKAYKFIKNTLSRVAELIPSAQERYSFSEALADLAIMSGNNRYYSGDSRKDMAQIIMWAEEFEKIHYGKTEWGNELEYMEEIEKFWESKALSEWSYQLKTGESMWCNFDHGTVKAFSHESAVKKAKQIISGKLKAVNDVIRQNSNTGVSIEMNLDELIVTKIK